MNTVTSRRLTLLAYILGFLFIMALLLGGITPPLNGGLYDQFMRLGPPVPPAKVLLITSSEPPQLSQMDRLSAKAAAANARALLLAPDVVSPSQSSLPLYQLGKQGLSVCVPSMEHGIHRSMSGDCRIAAIATELGVEGGGQNRQYLIDYAGGTSHIPRLSLRQAIDDEWLEQLANDRLLMIESARDMDAHLATPLDGSFGLSLAEYQAYAIDTMLRERMITAPGPSVIAIGVIVVLLLSGVVAQWLPATTAGVIALLTMAAVTVTSWWVLHYFQLWLPVTELNLAAFLSLLIAGQTRRVAEEREVDGIERRLVGMIATRLRARGIADANNPWRHVQRFVTQHLNLSRSILLELPTGTQHLVEVASAGCSIDDIVERRRDHRREPFKQALAARQATQLGSQFLQQSDDAEIEYLTPLLHAGQVVGYWYAAVDRALSEPLRPAPADINLFANQTATLLAQWRADNEQYLASKRWRRYLPGHWPRRYRSLVHAAGQIDDRMLALERVLNGLSRAILVFDLFGRLRLTNNAAEQLARQKDLAIYTTDGLSLLTQWCGLTEPQARELLRDTIVSHRQFDLPVSGIELDTPHVLNVAPVLSRAPSEDGKVMDGNDTQGILLELRDVSRLHQSHRWFQDLVGQFAQKVRNDLEAVSLAWTRVRPTLDEDQERVAAVLDRRLPAAAAGMQMIEEHAESMQNWDQAAVVPLDVRDAINEAIQQTAVAQNQARVSVHTELPQFLHLAFAGYGELTDLLKAGLNLLLEDASSGSQIRLIVSDVVADATSNGLPLVRIAMSNEGYGVPAEHVEQLMQDVASVVDSVAADDLLGQLAARKSQVDSWGARLILDSAIGHGFTVTIDLKGLKLD